MRSLDGGPQRRAAVPVDDLDVGALVDEIPRHVDVVVRDGHEQRRDAVRVGVFDVGAGREQNLRRFDPAVARRVQQRRHRAGNEKARSAIGQAAADDADAVAEAGHRVRQNPVRRRSRARLHVDLRATIDQQLDDVGMVVPDGHHQRRLLERRIARVDGGAAIEQRLDRVDVADLRRGHQRRFALSDRSTLASAPASSSSAIISALPFALASDIGVTP